MRYVTATFRLDGGAIHPWGQTLADHPDVERGPMYELELMDSGPAKVLCRLAGDVERGHELTRDHDLVIEVETADEAADLLYARIEVPPTAREMVTFPRKTKLVLSMPLEFAPDGGAIATFVGDDTAFADSLAAIPDAVEVELIETGRCESDLPDPVSSLTPRQQTILRTAVRLGHYEVPREATQGDVAAELGLSPGTVGEHLRKIESRVFGDLIQ